MRLFLIRHGQTGWNALDRAQGHTDIPLDETGLRQAESLGAQFAEMSLARVLSSDLARASQTASPVARASNSSLEVATALREKCFGDWEGEPFSWIRERTPDGHNLDELYHFKAPNGESFSEMWARLDATVAEMRECGEDVALVTHGGTACLLLAKLLCADFATSRSFRFSNASVTELERRNGTFRLIRYNDTSHLRAPSS